MEKDYYEVVSGPVDQGVLRIARLIVQTPKSFLLSLYFQSCCEIPGDRFKNTAQGD